jgi:hypothetical protein
VWNRDEVAVQVDVTRPAGRRRRVLAGACSEELLDGPLVLGGVVQDLSDPAARDPHVAQGTVDSLVSHPDTGVPERTGHLLIDEQLQGLHQNRCRMDVVYIGLRFLRSSPIVVGGQARPDRGRCHPTVDGRGATHDVAGSSITGSRTDT